MGAILILGGHRTGTSITARLVHELGFPAAPSQERLLLPRPGHAADNPDGYYEDVAFVTLHRRMLGEEVRALGGWRNPRRDDAAILRLHDRYRSLILERQTQSWEWSVKDPRLCLVGDVLLDALSALGIEVRVVTTVRSEADVASSLMRRGLPECDALRIAGIFEAGRQAVLGRAAERGIGRLELSLASAGTVERVERDVERLQTFLGRGDSLETRRLAGLVRVER